MPDRPSASPSPLLARAAEHAARYLDGLDARTVSPTGADIDALRTFLDMELPAEPSDPTIVLDEIDRLGGPATVGSVGRRYFGFVIGGVHPVALATSWLGSAWDQNAFSQVMSPAASLFEEAALRWLVEILGLPPGTGAAFVTGATMANLSALAARPKLRARRAGMGRRELGPRRCAVASHRAL